jgi:hypothetical protein
MQYIKIGRESGPSFAFPAYAGHKIIAMTEVKSHYSLYFAKETEMGSIVKIFWRYY